MLSVNRLAACGISPAPRMVRTGLRSTSKMGLYVTCSSRGGTHVAPSHLSVATAYSSLAHPNSDSGVHGKRRHSADREGHNSPIPIFPRGEMAIDELIAWAWENRRADILAQFGICVTFDF